MAKHITKHIPGTDDFELGRTRTAPTKYFLTLPDSGKPAGLVFVVHGFGGDRNLEYSRKLREHISDTYNLATVAVLAHAFRNRPEADGSNVYFEAEDIALLNARLQSHKCPAYNPPGIPIRFKEALDHLFCIEQNVAGIIASGDQQKIEKLYKNQFEALTAVIYPPNDEQQTFGILQAVDHLLVLGDLLGELGFPHDNIIAMGSSHGGYIANLMAKLAPNTFAAVFDNSSYPAAPPNYIYGREIKTFEHKFFISEHLVLCCYLKTGWTSRQGHPNTFTPDRARIRSFLDEEVIRRMAQLGGCRTQYRFYHSLQDRLVPAEQKSKMIHLLQEHGFDVQYNFMGKEDIDGRFVKNLDHGMNLSLKIMFDRLYPTITPRKGSTDLELDSVITYEGTELDYTFTFSKQGVVPTVSGKRPENIRQPNASDFKL